MYTECRTAGTTNTAEATQAGALPGSLTARNFGKIVNRRRVKFSINLTSLHFTSSLVHVSSLVSVPPRPHCQFTNTKHDHRGPECYQARRHCHRAAHFHSSLHSRQSYLVRRSPVAPNQSSSRHPGPSACPPPCSWSDRQSHHQTHSVSQVPPGHWHWTNFQRGSQPTCSQLLALQATRRAMEVWRCQQE